MNISFKKAVKENSKLLIEINNKAYYDDYLRYGECPGYNTSIEKMEKTFDNKNIERHIIYADNIPVGVVSAHKLDENKYYLGNLCIIPEYQHRGLGKSAIDFLLNHYRDLKELTLITPADKIENVNFYTKKCSFKIIGKEMDGNVQVLRFELKR